MEIAFQITIFIFSMTAIGFLLWVVFYIDREIFSAIRRERWQRVKLEDASLRKEEKNRIWAKIIDASNWVEILKKNHKMFRKISIIFVIFTIITWFFYAIL